MAQWVLKQLRQSEIGWFKACRREGRETGRQRGLNLPSDLVDELFGPGDRSELPVQTTWFDGSALRSDVRPIRRQAKNWRFVGPAVEGDRFAFAGGGDLIVMKVEVGDQVQLHFNEKGAKGILGSVTWDILPKDDIASLDDDLPEGLLTAGYVAGIRRLTDAEAAELVEVGQSSDLLTSFAVPSSARRPRSRIARSSAAAAIVTGARAQPSATSITVAAVSDLPPNSGRLMEALRAIGYTFPQAIADLVDNSINAHASTVLVRLFRSEDAIEKVIVGDDGDGMTEQRLHEAMRLGSDVDPDPASLGKYGLGMKLASLSRCRRLTVASRRKGKVAGRRWNVDQIKRGWPVDHLDVAAASSALDIVTDRLDLQDHGTVVVWEDLDRIRVSGRVKRVVKSLIDDVELHLGMCFHRFLEQGRLRILLDSVEAGGEPHAVVREVKPRNPFGYEQSGLRGYPQTFQLEIAGHGTLAAEAHVWPAQQGGRNYKLDGKVNERQGFYFYRNDRLIQAGGWNE